MTDDFKVMPGKFRWTDKYERLEERTYRFNKWNVQQALLRYVGHDLSNGKDIILELDNEDTHEAAVLIVKFVEDTHKGDAGV